MTHILSNMESFLLRRRHRCPTVITCFDLSVPWTAERLPLADRVIVTARGLRSELQGLVRLEHEPEVVYLAVPPTYRPSDVARARTNTFPWGRSNRERTSRDSSESWRGSPEPAR